MIDMTLIMTKGSDSDSCTDMLTRVSERFGFKGKESERERCSVVSNSLRPHGLNSPWNYPDQNTGVGRCSLLQGNFPNPGIKSKSPALQVDSLTAEPLGKPKNTGVGSLSLL